MAEITMPRLSDSMEEGTIVRWLKQTGEQVRRDEELVEIETDKATVTYEADGSGALTIAVQDGETVPVGAVIGSLGDGVSSAAQPQRPQTPPARSSASAPSGAAQGNGAPVAARELKASPVARRTAQRLGIELAALSGSGPGGRILRRDVLAAQQAAPAPAPAASTGRAVATVSEPAAPEAEASAVQAAAAGSEQAAPAAAATATARGEMTLQELTRTQTVIARRMAESRATVPSFSLQADLDMSAALAMRAQLKAMTESAAPSLNDIVVKACALALRRHPLANGSYRDGRFELHSRVNVGIAVAVEGALVVPRIVDADTKSLGAIAAEARGLVASARERTLSPAQLSGATFTVSNLGMYGIDRFEGIVSPPQAAILCVGAVQERPLAVQGRVEVRPSLTLTLACDHRILYGASAAEFLAEVRRLLEAPLAMAL